MTATEPSLRAALAETAEGVRIRLRVQPRARRTEVAGLHGEAVKLRIQAPPVDGKANEEVVRFLAQRLGVPRSQLELVAGLSGRSKVVLVRGLDLEAVAARLVTG